MQPQQIPKPQGIQVDSIFNSILDFLARAVRYVFSAHFYNFLYTIISILVVLLIMVFLYSLVRIYEIKQEKKKKSDAQTPSQVAPSPKSGSATTSLSPIVPGNLPTVSHPRHNPTWEHIRSKILSDDQGAWRLGIIEADIYMDKLLDERGVHGDTVSDKLKQVTPDLISSVQLAWEAHKVRNLIAHEGQSYILTLPESRRVLSYFEIVFRELGVIE